MQQTVIYDAAGNIVSNFGGGGGSSTVAGSQEQDVRSSGTLSAATANAAITIPINGQSTVGFTIAGLTVSGATLTFEQSNDSGTTWTGINEVNAGTGAFSGTRTTDGQARISVSGRTAVRMRVSTPGTGTISVAWNVSVREGIMSLGSPLPPGANTIGTVTVGNFPTTQPVSAAALPLPNGAAAETTQQGVANSNSAISTATGTQTDAATASGANTSIIGALRAIRDRLLATLSVSGTVGISQTTPGTTNAVAAVGTDGTTQRQVQTTTTGALQPPTAASGKIVQTSVALSANTSTQLVAARATAGDRLAVEIQCDGTAVVGIDRTGGTLTSATAAPLVIPAGSYPLYTPPIATQTAITAYTGTAQTCRVTEYLR